MNNSRQLIDLVSVGPATVRDFQELGITEVRQLVKKDANNLYRRLQLLKRERIDPCVLDVFQCAIEQARDPELPSEKCQWHYWSKVRLGKIEE